MTKTTVRNIAQGPRGLYDAKAGYVELAVGETRDVDLEGAERTSAEATNYFAFGAEAKAEPEAEGGDATLPTKKADLIALAGTEGVAIETDDNVADLKRKITEARAAKAAGTGGIPPIVQPTDELDKMSDADLRTTVAGLTGKPEADLPTDRDELLKLARA